MNRMANNANRWLIFVDTNIFLDFYRTRGDTALKQLDVLVKSKDRLITGDQVRMEYLKHRLKVVSQIFKEEVKKPIEQSLPAVLSTSDKGEELLRLMKLSAAAYSELRKSTEGALGNPQESDPVYQRAMKIWLGDEELNLNRAKEERFGIRELAKKRHVLGFPPKKPDDISIGDAVNWEWMIWCAKHSSIGSNVLIVSRDGDYGVTINNESYLNDWLKEEFRERVAPDAEVRLTVRITDAMRLLNESVSKTDESEEDRLAEDWLREASRRSTLNALGLLASGQWEKELIELMLPKERVASSLRKGLLHPDSPLFDENTDKSS